MQKATKADRDFFEKHCSENGLPFSSRRLWWHKTKEVSASFYDPVVIEDEKKARKQFITDIKKHAPKYPAIKYSKITDAHMMLIDIADLHIGKYATVSETGYSYDIPLATDRAHKAVTVLLQRAQSFPIERFLFPIGNDICNINDSRNSTMKGTPQDSIGMWWEMKRAAVLMYVEVLERLAGIAPVHVVFNPSNHDESLGFCIAEELAAWFRHSKSITFDVEMSDRKYYLYGQCLIGTQHGDGAKMKDLPQLMAQEAAAMWDENQYRYVICHHKHHWLKYLFHAGEDLIGVTVTYMRSPSPPDPWHAKHGYVGAPQAIDAFIFHPKYGQVDHMSCVFNK